GEAAPRPQPVHDAARDEEPDRVGELEREDDGGVDALVLPAELLHERGLEDPDDLAVDVVDRGAEEEQRADHPAVAARPPEGGGGRGGARRHRAHWFTPLARNPPSTARTWPVTKLAASEARYTAAPASSSARPKRRRGVRASSSLPRGVPSMSWRVRAVGTTPGAMALTFTPRGPHSTARDLVREPTPALLAE